MERAIFNQWDKKKSTQTGAATKWTHIAVLGFLFRQHPLDGIEILIGFEPWEIFGEERPIFPLTARTVWKQS